MADLFGGYTGLFSEQTTYVDRRWCIVKYINERNAIQGRRKAGLPAPWTDDLLMCTFRLPCVHHADSPYYQFIRATLEKHDDGLLPWWYVMALTRLAHNPDTAMTLLSLPQAGYEWRQLANELIPNKQIIAGLVELYEQDAFVTEGLKRAHSYSQVAHLFMRFTGIGYTRAMYLLADLHTMRRVFVPTKGEDVFYLPTHPAKEVLKWLYAHSMTNYQRAAIAKDISKERDWLATETGIALSIPDMHVLFSGLYTMLCGQRWMDNGQETLLEHGKVYDYGKENME